MLDGILELLRSPYPVVMAVTAIVVSLILFPQLRKTPKKSDQDARDGDKPVISPKPHSRIVAKEKAPQKTPKKYDQDARDEDKPVTSSEPHSRVVPKEEAPSTLSVQGASNTSNQKTPKKSGQDARDGDTPATSSEPHSRVVPKEEAPSTPFVQGASNTSNQTSPTPTASVNTSGAAYLGSANFSGDGNNFGSNGTVNNIQDRSTHTISGGSNNESDHLLPLFTWNVKHEEATSTLSVQGASNTSSQTSPTPNTSVNTGGAAHLSSANFSGDDNNFGSNDTVNNNYSMHTISSGSSNESDHLLPPFDWNTGHSMLLVSSFRVFSKR
ncbi:hypothetical protein M378DRAFT_18832 [Amanita muscaria Koide BX008]|uniref:Uncharacterized protein n=1 Tax=Amanita muscaria (strain Koide BX008) TaxID=946122 RepID=A0A0C2W097_AMAMK|nr:hypothetical protein M378DRAFT_18832 [Amanita muscaria Koide BX008]